MLNSHDQVILLSFFCLCSFWNQLPVCYAAKYDSLWVELFLSLLYAIIMGTVAPWVPFPPCKHASRRRLHSTTHSSGTGVVSVGCAHKKLIKASATVLHFSTPRSCRASVSLACTNWGANKGVIFPKHFWAIWGSRRVKLTSTTFLERS